LPTQTSFQTSIQTLVRGLLFQTALHTESSHLLLGASLTSLAISLISSISQGGGFNVREEASEDWSPPSLPGRSVRIVRPLRDIGIKECATYAWWQRITVVGKEKWLNSRQGIGGLTKGRVLSCFWILTLNAVSEFIVGLEKDYPSTVSTITRTCAKLAPKHETTVTCALCQRLVLWFCLLALLIDRRQTSPTWVTAMEITHFHSVVRGARRLNDWAELIHTLSMLCLPYDTH
jgi:cytoplasmic tRNA 2-thiolation protein 2